jgi:GPH family glycoside/pentoside/hexuronide:cation symporter
LQTFSRQDQVDKGSTPESKAIRDKMTSVENYRVALNKKLAYAAPAFALAVVGIPVYVYIPKFYTDVVGVNITALGYILFSVRIFDAVTDPAIGYLSDRTLTRFGRRRPYIAVGSILVAIAMALLLNPPAGSAVYETVWFAVSIYMLFLFWTAVVVPFESLGPEITFDYHERTSLFGLRDGFLIAGTLAAASSPAIVVWLFNLPLDADGERAKFFWISIIYAPLLIGTCWWCAFSIREKQINVESQASGLWRNLRQVGHNRPFVILLVAYTVSAIGNNLPATLILFYVEYVLQSQLADLFLILYFVTGIIFLPAWIFISRRTGKKAAWLASMAINTGAFVGVFFLGPGDATIYGILVFLSGIGFGATLAIPSAIQADVIDYDELLTGKRREGQYIGLWSISKKFAAAVGIGAGLSILGLAGYTPNAEQPAEVQMTLRVLYALVPSLCNIVAIVIAFAYPISSRLHGEIRKAIEQRRDGLPVTNPLKPAETII